MGSDDKYIGKPDDFSRKVGEKLREHQMPVDPDVWDSLKDILPPRKKPVPVYWAWAAAGVAVVVVALLFLLNPFADEPLLTEHSQPRKQVKQEMVVPAIIPDNIEKQADEQVGKQVGKYSNRPNEKKISEASDLTQAVDKNRMKSEEIVKPAESSKMAESSKPGRVTEPAEIAEQVEASKSTLISESIEIARPEETVSVPEKMPDPEEPVKSGTKGLPAEGLLAENDFSLPIQEQRGLRSLIAALGSGGAPLDFSLGSFDADNPIYDSPFPGGELNNGDGVGSSDKYNLLTPGDYTDIEHRLPVSFSLTADFPISKNASMETGLSYTYLFSRFRRNDNFIYRGTLRQHYIGIPVNLRYTVWQNETWNIYLLGGGSIEKGLRSVYKQEIEQNGDIVYHTNVYSRIDGFQFSAQGGAGFSYRLHNNLSLFGEPRLVYYFKNNQPMSARTENPLIFGLNMGIRIQFNSNK